MTYHKFTITILSSQGYKQIIQQNVRVLYNLALSVNNNNIDYHTKLEVFGNYKNANDKILQNCKVNNHCI